MDEVAAGGRIRIRRMRDEDDDYERMVRWRNEPHVREWWDPDRPPLEREEARRRYGPRVRGEDPATACMIELDDQAIGYIQFYRWGQEPTAVAAMGLPELEGSWGLDILLGRPDLVDRGFGSAAVDLVCMYLLGVCHASSVMLTVAVDNARAISAYEKAGFVRSGRVLDTDTRGGRRVESFVMIRERPRATE